MEKYIKISIVTTKQLFSMLHKEHQKKYRDRINFNGKCNEVLKRDKYTCQECGMTNKEHIKLYNCRITIDHIDGNKKNNCLDNLRTLCLSCHGKKDIKRKPKKYPITFDENDNLENYIN